jgi:hypothetical protein
MDALLYDSKFLVTAVVGHGPVLPHCQLTELSRNGFATAVPTIENIRPKLSEEFRGMNNEELMVQGIFLRAQKRSQA